ncbi:MAG: hypothetical protein E6G54_01705 [Actinobacteria bacterium]|nr:MAG: hypothetical protein E6G54_01705 [Actinomycetota bacterium]
MNGDMPDEVDLEEQADAVADFVEELLGQMNIDAIAEPAQQGDRFYVDVLEAPPEDLALLIGKNTGQEEELEPMDALERKIVHDAVASIEGVQSGSRGEDPNRFVVISPVD